MLLKILLHGSEDFSCNMTKEILKATFTFLKICERFMAPSLTILTKKKFPNGTYFSYIFYSFSV